VKTQQLIKGALNSQS